MNRLTTEFRSERSRKPPAVGKWRQRLLLGLIVAVILICLMWPTSKIQVFREKHMMSRVLAGLCSFHVEYNSFPQQAELDLLTPTEGTLLLSLLGQEPSTNPRNIKFIDLNPAENDSPGLANNPLKLVDSWSQPYHLILDTDNNGEITNPEASANPGIQPNPLKGRAAMYSSGPDRDPKTWQDNITSWR